MRKDLKEKCIGWLRKNERGYYLKVHNKLYFIDRHCTSDLSEGLCNYHITVDKDRYGFVHATMLETGTIDNLILEGKIRLSDILICHRFFGKMDIWKLKPSFEDEGFFGEDWHILIDGEICTIDDSIIYDFINIDLNPVSEDFTELRFQIAEKNAGVLSNDEVISTLIPAISNYGGAGTQILVSKGNNFVKVSHYNGTSSYYCLIDGKFRYINYCNNYFEDARDISKDVEEFVLSRHIVLYDFDATENEKPIYIKRFYINNSSYITRKFINGEYYTDAVYEKHKQELEDSAEHFEAAKKRVAKQLAGSKSLIEVMQKLRTIPLQMGSSVYKCG